MLSAKLTEGFPDPSVTAYAVPPFHSSTWSPRFVRKAHLRCSLFHWAYYGLFPPLAAAFVRPFFLREKGGFWMVLLHAIVPLPKRLPFRKKGAHGGRRLWRKQAEVSPMKQGVPQANL